ncbi:1-acyl-sn-glycerol-3-phosphate acyltransferase [Oceanispirochaeta crateris]|uniref:1-acyl-sn-glycerol-3-phosphate acyltransferase n=1 Tax=Oceanispirochaeta crateris TaxID=2518645 RepID=A0A5C1QJI4_9SPIO|nr:lysophospholipid acyltransferase family protein [Oceanispirochaeta crateris]QEN06754.1 1-acyl-sn-glycerol-3-phosphate acyltransferase [Oceanispirochaeta crateris]
MKKDLKILDGKLDVIGQFIWRFGSFVCRLLYNKRLNIQFENWDLLDSLEPPYLIVGNHVTNFDPIIISANQNHYLHWVANDAVFRHPFLRWAMTHLQIIPKTKGMSDLESVRIIHRKIREGCIVALYPEGQTSWDGQNQSLMPATPKLLKLLKVPVVSVLIKGGYLTQPRWVWPNNLRRSRIILEAKLILSASELKKLSLDEIDEKLKKGIFHDDFEFQKQHPIKLESNKRAETLELFTYICPRCHTLDALVSQGNTVECQNCHWEFFINEYGEFPHDENFPFENLSVWNHWQKDQTIRMVREYKALSEVHRPILSNKNLTILTGLGLVPLKKLLKGDLNLWQDRLEFVPEEGDSMIFPLDEIEAMSIFKQQKLEFYHKKVLYRFHFGTPRDSAYKWLCFLSEMCREEDESSVKTGTDGVKKAR